MNSAIASNINGGVVNNQQVASGSHSALLLSSIEFSLSETKTNFSGQGKYFTALSGKEVFNGGNKPKLCDLNKNLIEEAHLSMNGNAEKNSEDSIPVPKIQLYTGKIQVEWNHTHKIGAGLHNLGNTCFMNTVIQCLTYTPPLANYLLHDNDHASKCTITGFCMMCLLQKHMKRAIGKTGEVIKPIDVYQRLRSIAKHFQFGRQEDAHEFLRYVIDNLWKACLPQNNGVSKLDPASKETTVINKIFGGYHRSQVICMRCKKESNTFDHFMDFILDIKQNVMSLEKALEKFIQPELLQQENCYKCPKCKMKVEAQKRFSVYRAPTVATFQLKRFDYNRSFGGKITKQITYPEKLNLRPYMSETKGDPVWYRLNAVLVHAGASCTSGHYYCYVKNSNGFWYIMDDTRVQQVSLNAVLNQSAYVLFYIKKEISENSERPIFKKCLDNKSSFIKGNVSNSHFTKVPEMGSPKPNLLVDKISPYASSKSMSSPNSIKKLHYSSPTREKISFGFRSSPMSASVASSRSRNTANEVAPASHGGLVPYVEDSSESSDASDSNPSSNNLNNGLSGESKQQARSGPLKSNRVAPLSENKSSASNSNLSPASSVSSKVSATSPWIVTDAPQTPSSSNTSSVNSTTNWHVIEAPSIKSYDSMKVTPNKDFNKIDSPKLSMPILPTSVTDTDQDNLPSAKKLPELENVSSPQKCTFRKQLFKNKTVFPEDKETVNLAKRKYGDLYSKVSTDIFFEHSKNRLSPVSKKSKFDESSPFVNQENGARSESSKIDTVDRDSGVSGVQKHFSTPDNDNYSRTSLVNGVSGHSDSKVLHNQSSSLPNGTSEHPKNILEKDSWFTKGKHRNVFFPDSFQYEKGKFSDSKEGKNSSLYGPEVPTWGEKNPYRPSLIPEPEKRRSFDSYDQEFDRGKVRKSKTKDRYQSFQRKNPFQKHVDRYHGKYNNKFYSNHHNHRKYDSSHNNWKSNHSNNYHKYRNHHYRHY